MEYQGDPVKLLVIVIVLLKSGSNFTKTDTLLAPLALGTE